MSNKNIIRFLIYYVFRRKKLSTFLFLILPALFIDVIDDKQAFELYLQKLQKLSEYRLDNTHKSLVAEYYLYNKNRNPNRAHRHRIRSEFNLQKNRLRQEWSSHYSLTWPSCKYRISYSNNAKPSEITTKQFEAHHIVPINSGGINRWWNMSPISSENHQKLHASTEEHACFSHDIIERKISRLILRFRGIFYKYMRSFLETIL